MKSTILIVEDDLDDLELLKKKLSNDEYELIIARDGKTALALLDQERPDLVILDILLPDIDGFEICKRIRSNEQYMSLPILFHTKINTMDERLIGLEMGASDFLNKGSDERELLVRIKNLLEAKKVIDDIAERSVIDRITSCYNKMYFQCRIKDEFARSKRYKREFCCVFIGIDNFKKINQEHGYVFGDSVLKKFAQMIKQQISTADILFRYEGDVFALLLPETKSEEAYMKMESVRNFILTARIKSGDIPVSLTASCGISVFSDSIESAEEMSSCAEKALSLAKKEGGNQTRVFGKEKNN